MASMPPRLSPRWPSTSASAKSEESKEKAQPNGCAFLMLFSDMNDLQLARLKEAETLADVDVHLRVAAGTDGEGALLLRVQGILLGEVCLDGIRLLERGVDEVQLRIALVEVFLHDGVVRAAENQVVDLLAGENVVDLRGDLKIDVAVL